jgi:hypothetical protein
MHLYLLGANCPRDFAQRKVRMERTIVWLEYGGVESVRNGADKVAVRHH